MYIRRLEQLALILLCWLFGAVCRYELIALWRQW